MSRTTTDMFKRTHNFIQKLLGRSDVTINGSVYMRRWRLIDLPWFGVRIHHIVRSDHDREMHDHPFSFISFILRGGYYEHRPHAKIKGFILDSDGKRWTDVKRHGAGSIVVRKAEDLHRLDLAIISESETHVEERGTWTFVLRGPRRREWGFETPQGWMHWRDFIEWKGHEDGTTGTKHRNAEDSFTAPSSY